MSDNPMQTDGFSFVEFSSIDPKPLQQLFEAFGFVLVANHKSKEIKIYRHNKIDFLINSEPNSFASAFAKTHGAAACGMAFKVKDANFAYERALQLDAKPYEKDTDIGANLKAIYGVGDSLLYLVDDNEKLYEENFNFIEGVDSNNSEIGMQYIDHLTHNVFRGSMDSWAEYYTRLFNFREIRYFDIQGKHTGLVSRAMSSPCNKIRIPLNESKDGKSQIEEFLKEYNGEGIQHIALITSNIFKTVEKLKEIGMEFMHTPDTYYELLKERLPEHGEDIDRMQENKILIDGGKDQGGGYLLQIFTNTVIGPIFFEIIQRKGNDGFGEGNFQALFDSIELDQVRRGVLDVQ